MYTYHIFIIYLFVERYLGCFHFLTLVNREAVDTAKQAYVEKSVESLGHIQGVTWLNRIVDLILLFENSPH